MLAALRRFSATWPARILFIVLVGAFGLWGVSGVVLSGSDDPNTVATVGGQKIAASELQDGERRMLAEYMRSTGTTTPPGPDIRQAVAQQALQELTIQAAIAGEVTRLHLGVTDDALRQATFDTRGFQGPNGAFDRATFTAVLRNNNLTEARYLELMRSDLGQRQLMEAVRAGGYAPELAARLVFSFQAETRTADLVSLPFAAAPEPPAPTDEQIEREYDDNTTAYTLPEERRIKAVLLTPEGVARGITVGEADAHAYYDSHPEEFGQPETRSVQIVVAPTEAAGRGLATDWISGADWTAMQAAASKAGGSAIELDDQTASSFPSAELGHAVFAAPADVVTGPVPNEGAFAVFRIAKLSPASEQPFDSVAATIKQKVALQQATDAVYDRANKVQDALAGGAKLDELPGDLGLIAVTGTLDAQGNTPEGTPAPVPGPPALRQALIAHAFATSPSDQPTLENGPDNTFYAVSVDNILPPKQQPLDAVRDRVREDWLRDARRHEQDGVAARILAAVDSGKTLADAAAAEHMAVTHSPPIGRNTPPAGVPSQLVQPLFATGIGHATMVESPTGFVVAVPTADTKPDPATNPAGLDRVRTQWAASVSNDLEVSYATELRSKAKVSVNSKSLGELSQ